MGQITHFDISVMKIMYGLSGFVETGTWMGDAVEAAFNAGYSPIFSIELNEEICEKAVDRFSGRDNITILQGSSEARLPEIISKLSSPTLWWLDAHLPDLRYDNKVNEKGVLPSDQNHKFPLEIELKMISSLRDLSTDVIVIDDLRIYEKGPFEHGNAPWEHSYYERGGADFVEEILGKTHKCMKSYDNEGYIVCTPK